MPTNPLELTEALASVFGGELISCRVRYTVMAQPDVRNFEERYNACYIDFGLKTATGYVLGSIFSSFFLRGPIARWPKFICSGLGLGMAYSNCENSLNDYLLSLDPKLCKVKKRP